MPSPKPFPAACRVIEEADQRHSYDLHQQKLNAIKPSIDCTPPGHWSSSKTKSNGKKAVLQAEQASTIEKNNRLLLDKLVRIQSMSSRTTCKPPTERSTLRNSGGIVRDNATGAKFSDNINFHTSASKAGSLRTVRAAREAQEIQTMNAKIGLAILNVKPHYSAAQLEAQYAQEQEMLARLRSFRSNPRGGSEPNSRASSARPSVNSLPNSPHGTGATSGGSGSWSSPVTPRGKSGGGPGGHPKQLHVDPTAGSAGGGPAASPKAVTGPASPTSRLACSSGGAAAAAAAPAAEQGSEPVQQQSEEGAAAGVGEGGVGEPAAAAAGAEV